MFKEIEKRKIKLIVKLISTVTVNIFIMSKNKKKNYNKFHSSNRYNTLLYCILYLSQNFITFIVVMVSCGRRQKCIPRAPIHLRQYIRHRFDNAHIIVTAPSSSANIETSKTINRSLRRSHGCLPRQPTTMSNSVLVSIDEVCYV